MRKLKLGFGLAAAIAALPSVATAQTVIPPGNSAVNQYTQTYPTAGGNAPARGRGGRSPAKVLGARNAHRLDAMGPQGRAAAALAAATAPISTTTAAGGASGGSAGEGRGGGRAKGARHGGAAGHGSIGGGGSGSESGGPGGSSGFNQILGQATGSSSSGQMGLLLPLAIVAAVLWSLVYLWRQRRRTT